MESEVRGFWAEEAGRQLLVCLQDGQIQLTLLDALQGTSKEMTLSLNAFRVRQLAELLLGWHAKAVQKAVAPDLRVG